MATVYGSGSGAYFLDSATVVTRVCAAGVTLSYSPIRVVHVPTGSHFNVASWTPTDAPAAYTLSVVAGVLTSSSGSVY